MILMILNWLKTTNLILKNLNKYEQNREELKSSEGSAVERFLGGTILLKSNYFGSPSKPVESTSSTKIVPEAGIKTKVEEQEESTPTNVEKSTNKFLSAKSSDCSLSSAEEEEPEEMIGTLYFMDVKCNLKKNSSIGRPGIKERRLSAHGTSSLLNNPFLQASVWTENLKTQSFSEENWKSVFVIFQHRAFIIRCFSNILKICIPFEIDDKGNFYS